MPTEPVGLGKPAVIQRPTTTVHLIRGANLYAHHFSASLLLALLLSPAMARAQRNGGLGSRPARQSQSERPLEADPQQQRPQPEGFFRRLRELPPAEQKRFLANNPQFQRLSPDRQQLIRDRLRQWNAMTPQEKDRVRQREEILGGLSPTQRQEARSIFPQWRDLTPARRQAVMVAFRHLRDLSPDQRRSYLDSQYVREQFSPHERDILEGMNKLMPDSPAAAEGPAGPAPNAGVRPFQGQRPIDRFPELRDLPPLRRQAVVRAFRHLAELPPDQRRSFLDSPGVQDMFSPHEREILEGMNKSLPDSSAAAPNPPEQ